MSSPQPAAPRPNQPAQPMPNDTALVWREVKYYEASAQFSMEGFYVDFREAFDGWTKERFQKVDPMALRALKWTLRHRGVYTGNILKQTAGALADLAQLPCVEGGMWPRPPTWDRTEFMKMRFDPRSEVFESQQLALRDQSRQVQAQYNQMLQAQQPARQPVQQPVQQPVRGQPLQAIPSQPMQWAGIAQYQAPQIQQQRCCQRQQPAYQQQPNSGAAQPSPYSLHFPQSYNNQMKRKASQEMNPFPQQIRQRSAMNSSAQRPTIRQGSGQGSVRDKRYEDDVFEKADSDGDLHDDEDDDDDDD